jgi:exosome complex exonuclease DIS3/RRP44
LREAAATAKARGVVPTGRVVGIVKRAWRQYCGSLAPEEEALASSGVVGVQDGGLASSSALFVPVDPKIPRIRIDTRQRSSLADKRLVVAVDSWDAASKYPRGHYVRTLGPIGDKATETEVRCEESMRGAIGRASFTHRLPSYITLPARATSPHASSCR